MTSIPRELLLSSAGLKLPESLPFGVATVFFDSDMLNSQKSFEAALRNQGVAVLAWRPVPVQPNVLGPQARGTMPGIWHVLLTSDEQSGLERRLYLARKQFERTELPGYIVSCSCRSMVYKARCQASTLTEFYTDLRDPAFQTSFVLFHQGFAVTLRNEWINVQPFRSLALNGELNSIWGNRSRMEARTATLPQECTPIVSLSRSDAGTLDEVVELLTMNGRSIAEAVRLVVPSLDTEDRAALSRYICMEPWEGPAAVAFSNGLQLGAVVDQRGLRSCRFTICRDGTVIAGSETGLIDIDPADIIDAGSLSPGEMILLDLEEGKLYRNEDISSILDSATSFTKSTPSDSFLSSARLAVSPLATRALRPWHHQFRYTKEDIDSVIAPMSETGRQPNYSMGDDTPLTFLASKHRSFYAYFRQRCAQVTSPAIDFNIRIDEFPLHVRLGPWPHLLDQAQPPICLALRSPILSLAESYALKHGMFPRAISLPVQSVNCSLAAGESLEDALSRIAAAAIEFVRAGASILLLTDRNSSPDSQLIPMALVVGGTHCGLRVAGLRTLVSMVAEGGDCRTSHDLAVLIGMGCDAVCPWLALETAQALMPRAGEQNCLRALEAGFMSIMAKSGISFARTYCGSHLFDVCGLSGNVIERCFYGSPSPLSGIGFAELGAMFCIRPIMDDSDSYASEPDPLPHDGMLSYTIGDHAEFHAWRPTTVRALHKAVDVPPRDVVSNATEWPLYYGSLTTVYPRYLRDLIEIRPAGPEVLLTDAEESGSLRKKFVASAIGLHSVSPAVHAIFAEAMNLIGSRSNCGQYGELPAAALRPSEASRIKQVGSGRFGATTDYLIHAEEIEIDIANGSSSGETLKLVGPRVTPIIATICGVPAEGSLATPPAHLDIFSIEDIAQLIFDLKRLNPGVHVAVKLAAQFGVGTIAACLAKAFADCVVIVGNESGKTASSLSNIKNSGLPWEIGLAEVQQKLSQHGLRGRVRLRVEGGLRTARDVFIAALLGADEFAFGTALLVACGCDMTRQCHLGTCPVGIATQDAALQSRFRGGAGQIINFLTAIAHDLRQSLAHYGFTSLSEATGRTDLLEQVRFDGSIDLSPMLFFDRVKPRVWGGQPNNILTEHLAIDDDLTEVALRALRKGEPVLLSSSITNRDRAVGSRLAGELTVLRRGDPAGTNPPIHLEFDGTAGQSFGAFCVYGMTLKLKGLANDFVGKSLSGGALILVPSELSLLDGPECFLLGNSALYGATSGTLTARGRAGERFAARNAGALAVVEGVGTQACAYMSGGIVVVLGPIGPNFGAGMTGGTAWVYDELSRFTSDRLFHSDSVVAERYYDIEESGRSQLHSLISSHAQKTGSPRASSLLARWSEESQKMLRISPIH